MKELKIGEAVAFKCVKAKGRGVPCHDCALYDVCTVGGDDELLGPCGMSMRKDGENANFVRADLNEIIRERIEKSIDGLSGGDDDKIIALQSNAGECKIGFKASYWKMMLGEILKLEEEKEESEC